MTGILTFGIDVSHYSGKIDWGKVVAQNVHFVFTKATELFVKNGNVVKYKDTMFDTYWSALATQPVKRGVFHFCRPGMDPDDSMTFFFSVYSPKSGDLLPTLDIEDQYADDTSVTPTAKVAQIQKMVNLVSAKVGGKKPIIYTKKRVWAALGNPGDFGGCPLWVIDYNHDPKPKLPASWSDFTFWQTDQNLEMDGIAGDYDPDQFNGPPADLAKFCI